MLFLIVLKEYTRVVTLSLWCDVDIVLAVE